MKLLKAIAAILVVATTMVAFTSCSKDDNKDSASTTNAPASVADTDWEWYDPEATDVYRMQAEFNGPVLASVIREAMVDGIMDVQVYLGNYTYSNGSGTMSLENDNVTVSASFSIDGSQMTLTMLGGSYTLAKKQ